MRIGILVLLILLLPLASSAEQIMQYFRIQSGTGFFVNRSYIITNAHVVKGCSQVTVKGAVAPEPASVQVMDEEHDLALLEVDTPPDRYAPLRFNIDDLKAGDKVLVIGYPGEEGARGQFTVAEAEVQKLIHNVQGNPGQFYITDVIEHGNSGGPVFDTSGNVIGVVVAKSVLTMTNSVTREKVEEQHLGVVIALNTLKKFLEDHGVHYEWQSSGLYQFTSEYLAEQAKDVIVNVQCRKQTDSAGNLLEQ